jgi:hypothetical protein
MANLKCRHPCSKLLSRSYSHRPADRAHSFRIMGPAKSQKSRQSGRADGGSYTCDTCGTSVRNRGKAKHKCNNGGKALSDVFKEMAEQEALERGTIILLSISMFMFVDRLSFTARQLSLMANDQSKGQSSSSEYFIEIEPMILSQFFL